MTQFAPRLAVSIAGKVPRPKNSINIAESMAFACVDAQVNALYMSPQGRKPQTEPSAADLSLAGLSPSLGSG